MQPLIVHVPGPLSPIFAAAERVIEELLQHKQELLQPSEQGTQTNEAVPATQTTPAAIETARRSSFLIRGTALSAELFTLVRDLFGQGREAEADAFAGQVLLNLAQSHKRLQSTCLELEACMRERTMELERANERLRHEMAERERVEQQLRQAQKMEALGRLAGGIAHDFNNFLSIILGQSTLLATDPALSQEALREGLTDITRAAEEARTLTEQLLCVSKTQVRSKVVVDPSTVLTQLKPLLVRLAGPSVPLHISLGEDVPTVLHDPSALQQMLMNLVVNARDAMPAGGTLRLSTDRAEVGPGRELPMGMYAEIVVQDEGIGMDALTRERIFEPFFTTKSSGKGTGLGLSTVYSLVAQVGGGISVQSAPGQGASFRVLLPAHPAPAPSNYDEHAEPPPRTSCVRDVCGAFIDGSSSGPLKRIAR